MWMKEIFLGFIGLASGTAVSAGVFSFIITVGVVPRIIGKSRTATDIVLYENTVILGGVFGCLAIALAEILNTFPIMFRRFGIKEGLSWIMLFMALGKMAGAFYFYANHMQNLS